MKILVWGSGAMARAMAWGLQRSTPQLEFLCWNPTVGKAQALAAELGGRVWHSGDAFDAVILGFKPQKLAEAKLPDCSHATVISLLAATTLDRVFSYIPSACAIRTMPNLAVEKNQGVVLWAHRNLSAEQHAFWSRALSGLGQAHELADATIDLYTLVSGCAPAYAFTWLKSAEEFVRAQGGDPVLARSLLRASLLGALESVAPADDLSARTSQVTSKGGVTEAVLAAWQEQHASYIADGFAAGLARMRELSRR